MGLHELMKKLHDGNRSKFRDEREEVFKDTKRELESVETRNCIKYKSTLIDSANYISISSLRILRQKLGEIRLDDESNILVEHAIKLIKSWITNFKTLPHDSIQDWYTGNAGSIMDQLAISRFGDSSRDKRTFPVPANVKKMVFAFDLFLESMATVFDNFIARQFKQEVKKYGVIQIFNNYLLSLEKAGISGMDAIIDKAKAVVIEDRDKEPGNGGIADTRDSDVYRHIVKKSRNYIKMAEVEARSIANIVDRKLAELEADSDTRGVRVLKNALEDLADAADYELDVIGSLTSKDEVESGKKKDKVKSKIDSASTRLKSID